MNIDNLPLDNNKKGGYFRPIKEWKKICRDPNHNPPMYLYIPPGQEYVHICPSCGAEIVIRGQSFNLNNVEIK